MRIMIATIGYLCQHSTS